tara:strand:- start:827 stop:1036 length:210 start_codon:yes stop_codon:yes gene_type:complete
MIEIQQLIIKGKINGDFDYTEQEVIKIIDGKIQEHLSNYNFTLSKGERKNLINQCIDEVFEKIDLETKA